MISVHLLFHFAVLTHGRRKKKKGKENNKNLEEEMKHFKSFPEKKTFLFHLTVSKGVSGYGAGSSSESLPWHQELNNSSLPIEIMANSIYCCPLSS